MEKLKAFFKKIFFLPPLPTVIISVPSFIFVFAMLEKGDHSPLAYVAYLLSAYAMIITVTGAGNVVSALKKLVRESALLKRIKSTALGNRLLGDAMFRSEITLHGGLFINLLYVALNLFSGIRYNSTWFVALSFYYMLLSAMRAVLVRYMHSNRQTKDIASEFQRYRACGIILLLMNQALVGIVVYMVTDNRGFYYSGMLIYAMALYTFYVTILAIVNVIRFRSYVSPVLSAAKIISLTAALVSMLSLETAMISRFGNDQPEFRQIMTGAFGGAICAMVLAMAIYMIVNATKQLKRMKSQVQ